MGPRARRVARAQSAYFVATGLAPFVSRRAFEAVTGPKRDWWLVETVGAVVTAVGASLAVSKDATPALVLGVGSAAGLAAIDVVYYRRGDLRWTYLIDAALEAVIVAAWADAVRKEKGGAAAATPPSPA